MKPVLRFRRRVRLRLALLAIIAMLFQQAALASYVCTRADMPAGDTAMAMHCHDMPMVQAEQDPALCVWHCAQSPVSAQTASVPQVPPLAVAAVLPTATLSVFGLPPTAAGHTRDAVPRSRGLAPELRFNVLLI